jgi:hypothetical protein
MNRALLNLLRPRSWKAARAFLKALTAYHKGDYAEALARFDECIKVDLLRTDVNMAFRSILLVLNNHPNVEKTDLYKRIIAGDFRPAHRSSKYARAYADYFLGYATGLRDIVTLWQRAYELKPTKGFAARYLPLPDNPILAP